MQTEHDLAHLCLALIGGKRRLSAAENSLFQRGQVVLAGTLGADAIREQISAGLDPLGDMFSRIRTAGRRRVSGAVYTPPPIVRCMLAWLATQGRFARIVDPGAGSGRFILQAAEIFPDAHLVAVEMDPLAALMLRANLAVRRLAERTTVLVADYRKVRLPVVQGATAFVGNPPYVRHHDIAAEWKSWYASRFERFGIRASALAGLHLHFFLQTRLLASEGDAGAFITSAEWLDVNYGSALRRLFLDELGGIALHVLDPKMEAFPGTATTAAITGFRVGETTQQVRVRAVETGAQLEGLSGGIDLPRERLLSEPRWSILVRPSASKAVGGMELGELCRVHRGQVTGANSVWIAGAHAESLPARVKLPAVTKAIDLLRAGQHLDSAAALRCVIDLPSDLDDLSCEEQLSVHAFLAWAKAQGADQGYIARHRKAWWSVGLRAPAPILCTYMARRPPQFTLNVCGARHINVAHGLYPREPMGQKKLSALVAWLNQNVHTGSGRTYAGGLTKFEPKEVERLRVPAPDVLFA